MILARTLSSNGPEVNRRQQRTGRLVSQSAQPEFRPASLVIRRGNRCPGREHQRYRLRQQAAPDESEDLSRGLVEPLGVIYHAQQRPLLGRLRHQAEHPEGDHEPVGAISRGKPERDAEPAALRLGQRAKPAEHGSA